MEEKELAAMALFVSAFASSIASNVSVREPELPSLALPYETGDVVDG